MRVCGVDLSTKAIDLVSLDFDDNDPRWQHIDISGGDGFERHIAAALRVPRKLKARSSFFDDICSIYIEQPFGFSSGKLMLIAGAFIASLPVSVREGASVSMISQPTWCRKLCGSGAAPKEQRRGHLESFGFEGPDDSNFWDALGIAVVARDEILLAFGQEKAS